jgi:hypothetical protein
MPDHTPHNCYIPYCEECWHHFNPADPNDPTKDVPLTCEECLATAAECEPGCDCETATNRSSDWMLKSPRTKVHLDT